MVAGAWPSFPVVVADAAGRGGGLARAGGQSVAGRGDCPAHGHPRGGGGAAAVCDGGVDRAAAALFHGAFAAACAGGRVDDVCPPVGE